MRAGATALQLAAYSYQLGRFVPNTYFIINSRTLLEPNTEPEVTWNAVEEACRRRYQEIDDHKLVIPVDGPDKAAHEAVFVPRPASAGGTGEEDDGWLLAFVHDSVTQQTEVPILDARRVADGPVCTLRLRENAGITFHGAWVPATP